MDYALELLKRRLRIERIKKLQVIELMQGNGFHLINQDMDALNECKSISIDRIESLVDAISALENIQK